MTKTVKEQKLPWPQYLDENGTVTKQLSISIWPSNFLIDENGVIIQKNISPQDLELFLKANMKPERTAKTGSVLTNSLP